jgi:hypothetical protein
LTFRFQLCSKKTICPPPFVSTSNQSCEFHKRSQFFICAHNETRSIAVGVNNSDRSPAGIHGMSLIPSIIETRSPPGLTRSYPRRFTLITRTASCSRQLPWLRCRLPARLKLVCFPAHSPLPTAALPSMSLSPNAPFPKSRRVLCRASRALHSSSFLLGLTFASRTFARVKAPHSVTFSNSGAARSAPVENPRAPTQPYRDSKQREAMPSSAE